jgi:transcription initiation factor TFIIIB Brf1 subunit/transcription initiation factor TFIIB
MRDICKQVVHNAEELGIVCENTPPSVAASAIFMCIVLCGWNYNKKELEDACDISAVTISKCYKKLFGYRLHLFSPELKHRYGIT